MGVGVEEEEGVGGPAGRSEGEGDGEEVEEETEEWLMTSTRPCRQKNEHTDTQGAGDLLLEKILSSKLPYMWFLPFTLNHNNK